MVNSKTDVLLDLQKGLAGGEQHLTEYGFFVLEAYLESKIARGQTAKAARTKLDELEVAAAGAGLVADYTVSFRQIRQMLATAETGPLWQEVSPYHYRSRRSSSSAASSRSRALSAALPALDDAAGQQRRSREPSQVRMADTQPAVLAALERATHEEAYLIVCSYAHRKLLAGKDAYWTGEKLHAVERDVKSSSQYIDLGPVFVAVRLALSLPPSTVFRPAAMTWTFVQPPPTPAYDIPPAGPPPPSEASFEPDAPPAYCAGSSSTPTPATEAEGAEAARASVAAQDEAAGCAQ